MFAIIIVFELPPKESASNFVNLESLYGIWGALFTNKLITFIKFVNDKLIWIPSFNASPEVFVYLVFSEPAKSTKFNFPILKNLSPVSLVTEDSMIIVKIEWLLEE